MAQVSVRHAEPEDYEALHRIFSGPKAVAGTLQLPFPSAETWRRLLCDGRGHLPAFTATRRDIS